MERILPGTSGNVYTPYEERIGNESIVYFTRDLSPEGLQKVYEKINGSIGGKVAVKLHTGEKNGPNIIPRDWVKVLLEKDIPFYSMCEHHMLPFYGKAHVAYIPDGRVVGLSKLARCVEVYAKRLQMQERMTDQIADALMRELGCKGVMVLTQAEHTCMTMRGVKKPGTQTVSVAARGAFREDESLRSSFYEMLRL